MFPEDKQTYTALSATCDYVIKNLIKDKARDKVYVVGAQSVRDIFL